MSNKKFYSKFTQKMSDKMAQRFGDELTRIKNKEGELTPKLVVMYAENPRNPMNKWFDWDDTSAGIKFRKQQATELVGLVGEIVVIEGKRTKQRSFFGIKGGRRGVSYVTLKEVKQSQSLRDKLLSDIIRHLENTTDLMKMLKKY